MVSWVLFCIYIAGLAYFLFFSERFGRNTSTDTYRYNLVLFQEINRFITYREMIGMESFVINIIGNILAFSPFGFILPIISPRNRKFLHVLILSFELSLLIEVLQLVYRVGCFDVDDLFMNTLGGVIGYIVFAISYGYMKRRGKRR